MEKRVVFFGKFELDEVNIGFQSGRTIIFRNGNKKKSMSLEEFAEQIIEKMEFTDPSDRVNGPSVRITVDIKK